MTPGPRNQDLPPVIPNPTVGGGGWSTPSRPPGSFVAGGMTPGLRNQDLPPIVPNSSYSTLGDGWTPSPSPGSFGAGGMTPGPRDQDLPPVIPNPTVGGGWSTPGHDAGIFGTPGLTSQNLPFVTPNPTLDGVWSKPDPPPVGFDAGGMTPERKCHDLPSVIPNPTLAGEWSSLIHLVQIKEEERKRAENLLRSALAQLEVEVEGRDVLGARVRELEERVERVQTEQEELLSVDALKEKSAEQRGRASRGVEVEEGLKLKLSNTETEL